MSNFILELSAGLKKMFREKINIVIFLVILSLGFNVYSYVDIKGSITENTTLIKKKIDYRYFNTTKTLEQIHNVDVNTYNDELKPKINRYVYSTTA